MTDRVNAIPAGVTGAAGLLAGKTPAAGVVATGSTEYAASEVDYTIPGVDRLRPFLVTVVSDADLWMYLSSTGALTAGRNNEDRSLFPYETDDKLHTLAGISGPMTVIRTRPPSGGKSVVWRPFHGAADENVRRSFSKSRLGNRVTFVEQHQSLGLTFRASWQACDAVGWVRSCELTSDGPRSLEVDLLDGVVNLLPAHAELGLQRGSSCLINAYAQCELDVPSNLAIYSMASRITDRAEPSEALFANVAFATGLPAAKRWLSPDQLETFLDGQPIADEHLLTGRRGAFLSPAALILAAV